MVADGIRHRTFISYHHYDQAWVTNFINTFDRAQRIFSYNALGIMKDDLIDSGNTDYVMGRIRRDYIGDTTVTIVMVGACTYSRKYIDWEIAGSLHQGPVVGSPNGLRAILEPGKTTGNLPPRFKANWNEQATGYAKFYPYPTDASQLGAWISDAFTARTSRNRLISNGDLLFKINRSC